jgi:hypothetical protein
VIERKNDDRVASEAFQTIGSTFKRLKERLRMVWAHHGTGVRVKGDCGHTRSLDAMGKAPRSAKDGSMSAMHPVEDAQTNHLPSGGWWG